MSYPGSPVKGQDPGEGEERDATAELSRSEAREKICSILECSAWSTSLRGIQVKTGQN